MMMAVVKDLYSLELFVKTMDVAKMVVRAGLSAKADVNITSGAEVRDVLGTPL